VFAAAAQRVHTTVQALGENQDVFGFIHADLHQWNYMFHGEEVRAIDFDDCGWGYYTYDMAVTLSYLEDWGTFPALQDAFLTGYQRVRPLPRRYAAALPRTVKSRVPVKLFRVGHLTLMRTPVVKRQTLPQSGLCPLFPLGVSWAPSVPGHVFRLYCRRLVPQRRGPTPCWRGPSWGTRPRDLVRETARLFGYQRTGQRVEPTICRGITLLLTRQMAREEGGMMIHQPQ